MLRNHFFLVGCSVISLLSLSGCSDDPYAPLRERVDHAGKLSLICRTDVRHVPFEHSGNCIGASGYLWDREARADPELQVCYEQKSSVCEKIGDRESDLLGTLHVAIARSLFQFGKRELVLREEREGTHNLQAHRFYFFRSMPDLKAAFEECLAEYPDPPSPPRAKPPAASGRAPIATMPPLQNHKCIPEGVDLFGYVPL